MKLYIIVSFFKIHLVTVFQIKHDFLSKSFESIHEALLYTHVQHQHQHTLLGQPTGNARSHSVAKRQHQIRINGRRFAGLIAQPTLGSKPVRLFEVVLQATGDQILCHSDRLNRGGNRC